MHATYYHVVPRHDHTRLYVLLFQLLVSRVGVYCCQLTVGPLYELAIEMISSAMNAAGTLGPFEHA